MEGYHLRKTVRRLELCRKITSDPAFLDIDHREGRIRGEGHRSFLFHTVVVGDIGASALLVSAKDQADVLFHRDSKFIYGTHRVEGSNCRSLIVRGSAAIDLSVFYYRLKRFCNGPAVSGRNNVQMCQNIELCLFVIHVNGSNIVVIVVDGKTVAFRNMQSCTQCLGAPFPIRFSDTVRPLHTVDPAKSSDVLQHFFPVRVNIPADLLFIHNFRLHISFVITHFTDRRDRLIPGVSEIVKPAPLIPYLFCAPVIGCMPDHKPALTRFIVCFAGVSFIYLIS